MNDLKPMYSASIRVYAQLWVEVTFARPVDHDVHIEIMSLRERGFKVFLDNLGYRIYPTDVYNLSDVVEYIRDRLVRHGLENVKV